MKLFSAVALTALVVFPLASQASAVTSYFDRIQTASWHADIPALTELSKQLNTTAANNDAETGYAAAYADYRLACAGMKDPKQYSAVTDAALERADNRLSTLSQRETPYQAESLALLSTVYGMKIGISPAKSPVLGIMSGRAIAQAEKLAPDNPRVQLFKGVGKLYTPAMFGGDRAQALTAINAAIATLSGQRGSTVNWGLDDAYIWRGIALQSGGQANEAKASFEKALAVAPEHEWAKHLLAEMNKSR